MRETDHRKKRFGARVRGKLREKYIGSMSEGKMMRGKDYKHC